MSLQESETNEAIHNLISLKDSIAYFCFRAIYNLESRQSIYNGIFKVVPNNQFASLSELLAQYTPTLANPQYKISPIKIPQTLPIKHFIIE